jgi:tetratricopeptide (TPR) repeat protein
MRAHHVYSPINCKGLAALLLLAFSPAPAEGAPNLAAELNRAEELLFQWQLPDASKILDGIGTGHESNPRVNALLGLRAFFNGHYDDALKRFDNVKEELGPGMRMLRNVIKDTADTLRGYRETLSAKGHFRIRTNTGKDHALIPFIGDTLERIREQLLRDLGYAPTAPIVVEIYPAAKTLAAVSTLTEDDIRRSGTIALCKYNRLMIVSPLALLRGYSWRDTLAHEYVHLVVTKLSLNKVPIWIHEGLAKHFETSWRSTQLADRKLSPTQEHLLASGLAKKKLIPWKKMHPSMAKLPDQHSTALAFAQVQTAIDYINESAGHNSIRQLIDRLRGGEDQWLAVKNVTGLTQKAFTAAHRKYLRSLKLKAHRGLAFQKKTFGKKLSKEKQIAALRAKRAERFFRLADMLRQRRLTHAAVVEYRKARDFAGERDNFVANALARAYLEIDSPNQAISALLPVLEYYPEIPSAQSTIGLAYLRSGDQRAAERHLNVALRINPFSQELHCALSKALPVGAALVEEHRKLCREGFPGGH